MVLPGRVSDRKAVVCEGTRIWDVVDREELDPSIPAVDVGGRLVTPGMVDLHAHGALGHAFADAGPEAFRVILGEYARCGITAVQATFATAAIEQLTAGLAFARSWLAAPRRGCAVVGVHLEGPYFSYEQRGAQNPAHLRSPDDGSVDRLLEYADVVTMMSFAPELTGAVPLTRRLVEAGVVAAAGHSSATDEDLRAVVDAGLRHVIHLWSGQSTTVRQGPWRRPGLLEASLASEGLTAELIADNRHLPATLMALAYRCLAGRLCAVSDASTAAGLPEGAHYEMSGVKRVVRDGVGMLLDGTSFAGSTTLVNQMVPVLRDVVGVPLREAVAMVTAVPAGVIGLDGRKGSIEAGKDADIVVFNDDFSAWRTMIAGQWYEPEQAKDATADRWPAPEGTGP